MTGNCRGAVVAVGSVHVDLIATAPRLPRPGEGVLGEHFAIHPGGKASNQAAQVVRCGVRSSLVGRVGADPFGVFLRERLAGVGVDLTCLVTDPEIATGASPVFTDAEGTYASVIVPGAAGRLSTDDIEAARPAFVSASLVMLQLEIDPAVSLVAAEVARSVGCRVLLNASPASADLPSALLAVTDVLVVNAGEAAVLAGRPMPEPGEAPELAIALRERFDLTAVVITNGERGAVVATAQLIRGVPAHRVAVVETIGAGDAFAGALAAELASGVAIEDALITANAAGALAVTKRGAFDALPTTAEIRALFDRA